MNLRLTRRPLHPLRPEEAFRRPGASDDTGEGLVRPDQVAAFAERACAQGGLGRLTGLMIMPEIINLLGLAPLIGG